MAKKKESKKSVAKPAKKKTATPKKKYRITVICSTVGGPVTAEGVGLSFRCPSCKGKIVVEPNFTSLLTGDVNHSLRQVKETH